MRKLTVTTFMSLDGVVQSPGGPEEDPSGGFGYGGWTVHFWDELMAEVMARAFDEPHELLLGRRTYEIFAAHWRYITGDPIADRLNQLRKYVASRTLSKVSWQGAELLRGDVAEAIRAIKATPGPNLQVQGSSVLVQTLLEHDLVDEFTIWTFPVLLGRGKRLFGHGTPAGDLQLETSQTSTTGVLIATYARAGDIPLGDVQPAEPSPAELARRLKLQAEGRSDVP